MMAPCAVHYGIDNKTGISLVRKRICPPAILQWFDNAVAGTGMASARGLFGFLVGPMLSVVSELPSSPSVNSLASGDWK